MTNEEQIKGHHTCIHSDRYDYSCGHCIDFSRRTELEGLLKETNKIFEEFMVEDTIIETENGPVRNGLMGVTKEGLKDIQDSVSSKIKSLLQ